MYLHSSAQYPYGTIFFIWVKRGYQNTAAPVSTSAHILCLTTHCAITPSGLESISHTSLAIYDPASECRPASLSYSMIVRTRAHCPWKTFSSMIRVEMKSWIRIQIRIETNGDPQQWRILNIFSTVQELEQLQSELRPLEAQKAELKEWAERRTQMLTWIGLGEEE